MLCSQVAMKETKHRNARYRSFLASALAPLLLILPPCPLEAAEEARPREARYAHTILPSGVALRHPLGWSVQDGGDVILLLGHDTGEAIIVGCREDASAADAGAFTSSIVARLSKTLSLLITDSYRLGGALVLEAVGRNPNGLESAILVLVMAEPPSGPVPVGSAAAGRGFCRSANYATYAGPVEGYDPRRVSDMLIAIVSTLSC